MKHFISFIILLFAFTVSFALGKPEGLFINSKAPDFKAKDQSGVEVSLRELKKKGPVVLIFYRGNWCPYCSKALTRFRDSLQYLTEKGAQVIAITPEAAAGISKTIDKTKAVFPIVSDEDAKIAKGYKVAYTVDERTFGRYKNADIDLLETNAQKEQATLPVPAVYIVNKDGAVTYRFFNEDYKKRPWVKDILNEIK